MQRKRYTSFEEAWTDFERRTERLESFFDEFPDDAGARISLWLIIPPVDLKARLRELQGQLAGIDGVLPVPAHFMHVTVGDFARSAFEPLRAAGPFEIRLPRVTCFPTAVVVEAEAPQLAHVDERPTFLPHLSVAYLAGANDPEPLRRRLRALRHRDLGSFVVDEIVQVDVPAGRGTVTRPWRVTDRVSLRR